MKILHICAGWQTWNGAANIARMMIDEQRRNGHEVSFATWAKIGDLRAADEVWIHCGWLPCLWWANLWAKRAVRMPEACYDPVRLTFSGWKKGLVGPIERWALRRCTKIIATCEAEKAWIKAYLGKRCPAIDVTDIKRFFGLKSIDRVKPVEGRALHLLYLGRRHPLKGVAYLETAVSEFNASIPSRLTPPQLKVVSGAFGEEKENIWAWCDVLVLPTLSENFGLVVAEALERGKRVITTDGAPVWNPGDRVGVRECVIGGVRMGEGEDSSPSTLTFDANILIGYGGRLLYLKGYRDGDDTARERLLKEAIEMCNN